MKCFVSAVVLSLFVLSAGAVSASRPAMSNRIMTAERYTASVKQLKGPKKPDTGTVAIEEEVEEEVVEESKPEEPEIDRRDAEREACLNNNVGIGNTFVWASRYSDTSNYANMIEDAEHPENNVCFVRVELNSTNESRVKVSDVAPKYFMWEETIKCGSWVDKKEMEKRILEAKKGARIGGIVASTVGGLGLGVASMELFGNKLIGGKVQGQKSAKKETLYKNQLLALKKKGGTEFEEYKRDLALLVEACQSNAVVLDNCSLYSDLYEAIR